MTQFRNFVNGNWCDAESGDTFETINPANGDVVGHVTLSARQDARAAIAAARKGHEALVAMTTWERAALCTRVADIIAGMVFRLLVVPDYGLLSGILQNPAIIPPDGLSVLTAVPPRRRRRCLVAAVCGSFAISIPVESACVFAQC